jgi:hypothetical protein
MLTQVLALFAGNENLSLADLSERLGAAPALLASMLDDLAARGYLVDLAKLSCAGGACRGCSQQGACKLAQRPSVWALTPKGKDFAARQKEGQPQAGL